eukprot:scaffold109179_cov43-Prasinocladus_malaysianus.AAC.1
MGIHTQIQPASQSSFLTLTVYELGYGTLCSVTSSNSVLKRSSRFDDAVTPAIQIIDASFPSQVTGLAKAEGAQR